MKGDVQRRILVIGCTGQVGWELMRTLGPLGEVVGIGQYTEPLSIDLSNPDTIRDCIREVSPDLIVNAAAYTAVDKAEEEPDLALAINGTAPGILAEEAKRLGSAIVHYSTDYVFDGTKTVPYTEEDQPNPINVYGRTKLLGEQSVQSIGGSCLILRTSWVYGLRGKNFLLTVLRLAQEREELQIVDDQIGSPTWARMVAEGTGHVVGRRWFGPAFPEGCPQIYHLSATDSTSWYGFAAEVLKELESQYELKVESLKPISTDMYPTRAPRPRYSVLSGDKIARELKLRMPTWRASLRLCVESPT